MLIKLLDSIVADKIAAGEVVERPASIVKELAENSLDAGATAISLEIRGGGIDLIRIADNGCGMEHDDVKTAFLRHATSKISTEADLVNICTLGFRGEALASIAAVSRVRLITRQRGAEEGSEIQLEGGEITKFSAAGCPEGTGIWVSDLFYNTPVRRKFLKKPAQEAAYISDAVTRLALSNPDVSFRFSSEGKTLMHTPGDGKLISAIRAIYGAQAAKNMIFVNYESHGVNVSGFVGNREMQKNNRSHQLLFVNGRSIRNQLVSAAVADAFQGRLNIGKFAFFVLSLSIDGTLVDVNVHPNKQEVRFADGLPVYETVLEAVRSALAKNQEIPELFTSKPQTQNRVIIQENLIVDKKPEPQVTLNVEQSRELFAKAHTNMHEQPSEVRFSPTESANVLEKAKFIGKSGMVSESSGVLFNAEIQNNIQPQSDEQPQNAYPLLSDSEISYRIAGRLFDTYIIIENDDNAYIIDQHAAHERLIFERLSRQFEEGAVESQLLLVPEILDVSGSEKALFEELLPQLCEIGYEIEAMGERAYAVRAVPAVLGEASPTTFISSLLDERASIRALRSFELKRAKLMQLSCKSAIKAGDKLSDTEIKALMELIIKEGIPLSCPHGRPILIKLSRRELEVRFKRIQ